jgi:hypothetical protein
VACAGFFKKHAKSPSTSALKDALGLLEGRALYDGKEREVFVRMARRGDAIYLDLGNPKWEVVKITADGWTVERKSSVRFRERTGTGPHSYSSLVGTFQFGSPFPVLVMQGARRVL